MVGRALRLGLPGVAAPGVGRGWRGEAAWWGLCAPAAGERAARRALMQAPSLRGAAGKGEEKLGLPAEFLIGADGRILAAKYGKIVDDHWSVDGVLNLA